MKNLSFFFLLFVSTLVSGLENLEVSINDDVGRNGRTFPESVSLADGGFVFVWEGRTVSPNDWDIYFKKYNLDGQVNV